MDKNSAAQKLISFFGDMNAIGVAHSILVETSKYIIILMFALYTWYCFTVFARKNEEKKEHIYKIQNKIMYTIHFICSLVLYLNSLDWKILVIYAAQVGLLLFINKAYIYVYQNASKMVLNNMLMLLMTGMVMIGRIDQKDLIKQMGFIAAICVLGLFIPLLIERFHYFDRFGLVYAVIGILMLALVFVIGRSVNGSKNWIMIAGVGLQPSEFVKIIYVFFLAAMLKQTEKFIDIVKIGVIAAIHVLILVVEKDLGAALIYYITFISILYVATQKIMYLLLGLGAGSGAAFVAYHFFTHVQTRVIAWKDPWSTISKAGFQVAQSLFAIGTGGWFGMGLGEGLPTSIPVAKSDFIFSAISEELGAFFAICLILVELSCFIMFINIAVKMKRRFYKLTALGLSIEYIFQVLLTIGGVTKFIPSTGVTLPLVSYGGSSIISTIILFCIIQGMYVLNCREEKCGIDETAKKPRR